VGKKREWIDRGSLICYLHAFKSVKNPNAGFTV